MGDPKSLTPAVASVPAGRWENGAWQPRTAAAGDDALRNPYHGTEQFGGRPEWSHTWFHGTVGEPDFGERRKHGTADERMRQPPDERQMSMSWHQPNQLLGVHFSPLHEVAHKFAPSISSKPTSIVHARLGFTNPAVYDSEDHLNIAMADWAGKYYRHWHNDKLNQSMSWNYSDQQGTHRDFSRVPDDQRERWHLSQKAQSLLQWHPHLPEIIAGFRQHLSDQGHHGIIYGNSLEGPYETDVTRGGDASMRYIKKRENWPRGHPYSFSAIAQPEDIHVTHVEHISPWREEPQPHQHTWEDASDSDEPDEMRDKVLDWHRQHGGKLPFRLGAAHWVPSSGIFAPTTGLDQRLFEDGVLRPQVTEAIMERLDRCIRVDIQLAGSDWQDWMKVYLAGGSASEWAGGRPNDTAQDLDVLVGIDLKKAQGYNAFEGMDEQQAATALNAAFRGAFNETAAVLPGVDGTWDLTAYCNPAIGTDITAIRPYAAWDLSDNRWAVKPPHLPEHTLADFDPATLAHARAVLAEARAILKMPEPLRTREARDLWAHVHAHRCAAFSEFGEGWQDPGNVDDKWLQYAPGHVLDRIKALVFPGAARGEHEDWPLAKAAAAERLDNDEDEFYYGRMRTSDLSPTEYPHILGSSPRVDEIKADARITGEIREPIEVHQYTNDSSIRDGNHRWRAAMDLGIETVPVKLKRRVPGDPFGMIGPVRRTAAFGPLAYAPGDALGQVRELALAKTAAAEPIRERMMPVEEVLSLRSGDFPEHATVRDALDDIKDKFQDYEDGGRELRDKMSRGILPGYAIVVNHGQLDDGHRRLWMAHDLGHPAIRVRNGAFGPGVKYDPDTGKVSGGRRRQAALGSGESQLETREYEGEYGNPSQITRSDRGLIPTSAIANMPGARGELPWGDEQWAAARREPWHAAAQLAQEQVRWDHPRLTMRFPRSHEGGDDLVGSALKAAGYEGDTEGAFVARHPHPEKRTSNPSWLGGKPGVALHPDKWDYGTVIHEAAHHAVMYKHGIGPNESEGDEQIHGPEWAGHYARGLNWMSPGAGDDYLAHHQRYYDMIQEGLQWKRPKDLDEADRRGGLSVLEGARNEQPDARAIAHEAPRGHADTPTIVATGVAWDYPWSDYHFDPAHPDLEGMHEVARHSPDFKTFLNRNILRHNYHGRYWHLTHDPDFKIRSDYAPQEGSSMGSENEEHGLMVSTDPENWHEYMPHRQYAAEIALHGKPGEDYEDTSRGFGHEIWVNSPHKAEVLGVYPYEEGMRKHNHFYSRIVPDTEEDFRQIWDRAHGNQHTAASGYDGLTPRSAMIYLEIPEGLVQGLPGGVDDHHVTLIYLGKNVGDEAFEEACRRAGAAAASHHPMNGVLHGIETFPPDEHGKVPAFIPAYIPGVGKLRQALEDLSASQHRHFRPHVTLASLDPDEDLPEPHPPVRVRFTHLNVKRGGEVMSYPLGHPVTDARDHPED